MAARPLFALFLFSLPLFSSEGPADTNLLWLEDVQSQRVDDFVMPQNNKTLNSSKKHPLFEKTKSSLIEYWQRKQNNKKQSDVTYGGDWVYNFYTDDKNIKGIYRRAKKKQYIEAKKGGALSNVTWQEVFNLKTYIKSASFPDGFDASFGGVNCYTDSQSKNYSKCLVGFSHSGGDHKIIREFDVESKTWSAQETDFNFNFPSSSKVDYLDRDTVIVTLDELSHTNYKNPDNPISAQEAVKKGMASHIGNFPRNIYLWRRGEAFNPQKGAFFRTSKEGAFASYHSSLSTDENAGMSQLILIREYLDYFNFRLVLLNKVDGKNVYDSQILDLPKRFSYLGATKNKELFFLVEDKSWKDFKFHDVVKVTFTLDTGKVVMNHPTLFFRNREPGVMSARSRRQNGGLVDIGNKEDHLDDLIFILLNKNISTKVLVFNRNGDDWSKSELENPLGLKINASSIAKQKGEDVLKFSTQSFLTPSTTYTLTRQKGKLRFVFDKKDDKEFNSSPYQEKQLWVERRNGNSNSSVRVPYFIVYNKNKVSLENNKVPVPVMMYGYGGFNWSLTPRYIGVRGKHWLDKGGVYVVANIRGGGEFGVDWHQAGLKEKRANTYGDFFAIAEDLIRRNITTPAQLGILGGSNGGLLTGVAITQRPDLFGAAISVNPLLDMKRFHKIVFPNGKAVGSAWMAEYGDPDGQQKKFWDKYSPLHNLNKDTRYPNIFVITRRNDDRVHPAHGRKFAHKMGELGHVFTYYEDLQGGHLRNALSSQDQALRDTLIYVYFYKQLFR